MYSLLDDGGWGEACLAEHLCAGADPFLLLLGGVELQHVRWLRQVPNEFADVPF